MDCIVAAGGRIARSDPLYSYTNGEPKSLLQIGERTMLEHVVSAIKTARNVDGIVIVGLDEAQVRSLDLCEPMAVLPEQGGLIRNVNAGLEWLRANRPPAKAVLISTADIPLLTAEIVDAFIVECQPFDHLAYYNLVSKQTMERRFPDSGRTFVKLKGIEVAGGDLLIFQPEITETNKALWDAVVDARKHAWRLARLVGFRTVFKLVTRQLKFSEIEELASRVIEAPVRILNSPYAELAMDVDKPRQIELLQKAMVTQQSTG